MQPFLDRPLLTFPIQMTMTMWAYATLGMKPGDRLVCAFEEQLETRITAKPDAQAVSNLLWVYSVLGNPPRPKLLASMCQVALECLRNGTLAVPQAMSQLRAFDLTSELLGWGDGGDGHVIQELRREFASKVRNAGGEEFPESRGSAIENSNRNSNSNRTGSDSTGSSDADARGNAGVEGGGLLAGRKLTESPRMTNFHEEVASTLRRLGASYKQHIFDKRSGYTLDILVHPDTSPSHGEGRKRESGEEIGGERGLGDVIEINGPLHYCPGGLEPTGATILRGRILRLLGYRLVEVPYSLWNLCAGDVEKEEFLRSRLKLQ